MMNLFDFKLIGLYSIESSEISDELKKIYKEKFEEEWKLLNKDFCLEFGEMIE